jgi:hypothetical protein
MAIGLMVWLVTGLMGGLAYGLFAGLVAGLIIGAAAGLVAGLGTPHALPAIAAAQLARRWHTPPRLMAFLDDLL